MTEPEPLRLTFDTFGSYLNPPEEILQHLSQEKQDLLRRWSTVFNHTNIDWINYPQWVMKTVTAVITEDTFDETDLICLEQHIKDNKRVVIQQEKKNEDQTI